MYLLSVLPCLCIYYLFVPFLNLLSFCRLCIYSVCTLSIICTLCICYLYPVCLISICTLFIYYLFVPCLCIYYLYLVYLLSVCTLFVYLLSVPCVFIICLYLVCVFIIYSLKNEFALNIALFCVAQLKFFLSFRMFWQCCHCVKNEWSSTCANFHTRIYACSQHWGWGERENIHICTCTLHKAWWIGTYRTSRNDN